MINETNTTGTEEAAHIQRGCDPVPNSLKFIPQTEQTKDKGIKVVPMTVNLCTVRDISMDRLDSSSTAMLANVAMPCSHSFASISARLRRYSKSESSSTADFSAVAFSIHGHSRDLRFRSMAMISPSPCACDASSVLINLRLSSDTE